MQPWKTLSRQTILDHSRYLVVENHTVELPDGQVIADWPWIITPDYVNIVAITEDDQFLCFRQLKYSVDGITLALPGGYIDPGEAALTAAHRELLEETGYEAPDWTGLGQYPVDGNRGAGQANLFLARGARPVTDPNGDDLEEQQLHYLSRSEIETALVAGEFKVLAWAAAVALALLRLK